MTVITGDAGQLMLATPELKLLGFFLVTGETGLGSGLSWFFAKGHQSSHPLAATGGDVGFPRTMTGLTPPVHRRVWGGLLQEFGMRGGTQIFPQSHMASHTDLRPDIRTLLLWGGGSLLPTHETPSHPCSDECYEHKDCAIAWHPLSFPVPTLGTGLPFPGRAVALRLVLLGMDLVDGKIPPVTVADGTGLDPRSSRIQLGVRCRLLRVMAGRTGRGDRECFHGLQYRFLRVNPMMHCWLHIRSQDALVRDQEFATISCSSGDMTLLTVAEVSREEQILHIRRRAIGGKEEIRFSQVRPPVDLVNQHFEVDREGLSSCASGRGRLPSQAIKGGIVAQHTVFGRVSGPPVDREVFREFAVADHAPGCRRHHSAPRQRGGISHRKVGYDIGANVPDLIKGCMARRTVASSPILIQPGDFNAREALDAHAIRSNRILGEGTRKRHTKIARGIGAARIPGVNLRMALPRGGVAHCLFPISIKVLYLIVGGRSSQDEAERGHRLWEDSLAGSILNIKYDPGSMPRIDTLVPVSGIFDADDGEAYPWGLR